MLTERIIGAFTFRRGVYAEVEQDTSFTTTAWIIVAVVAFLNQIGTYASTNLVNWLLGAILGTILAIIGFAVGALVINWVGRIVFNADVSFDELVRTLGLAYVWNVIGLIGVLAISDALACLLAPVMVVAAIAVVIAWFWAAKEALDLEWVQTIVTVILGWLALALVTLVIGGLVLGALGLGAAVAGGIFGS
jgi:hypothetical protein